MLKGISEKMDFKELSDLVEEYNSLPLLSDDFDEAKELYGQTL